MHQRLRKLKQRLARRKLDAMLISQPQNRRYLSGFTAEDHGIQESAGHLLIRRKGTPLLLTDSRFELAARQEATGYDIAIYRRGLLGLLAELLPALAVKRLAFESHYTLYDQALALQKKCKKLNITPIPLANLVEKMRRRKEEAEIAALEKSVHLNEEVFQEVFSQLAPGLTEIDIARRLENAMYAKGAEGPSFATIVASGPNGALPHAVPGQRRIQAGEPVVIDMGLVLDGYCSDMTRTIAVGEPSARMRQISHIVRTAQLAATRAVRAGVSGKQVDSAARQVIRAAGYGDAFGHGLGHGVGLAVHEAPSLSPRATGKLQTGMVVTVEPGIYLADWGGVRLENMVVVEESGCRLLNRDTTLLDLSPSAA